jgi:hypothetical protein
VVYQYSFINFSEKQPFAASGVSDPLKGALAQSTHSMSLLSEREAIAGEVSAPRQELDCRNMPTMADRPFESRETIHVYLDVDHEAERSSARLGRSEIGGVIAKHDGEMEAFTRRAAMMGRSPLCLSFWIARRRRGCAETRACEFVSAHNFQTRANETVNDTSPLD